MRCYCVVKNFVKIIGVKTIIYLGCKLNFACTFYLFHLIWIKFSPRDNHKILMSGFEFCAVKAVLYLGT
jgi:hypothetical protein